VRRIESNRGAALFFRACQNGYLTALRNLTEATLNQNTWLIIINPNAGFGRGLKRWHNLKERLVQLKWSFVPVYTSYPGHAAILVQEYIQKGYFKIVCVGGDGTNNEIINGLMKHKSALSNSILYAIFPAGSGNDFARHFKISRHPQKWMNQMSDNVSTTALDVGAVRYQKNGIEQVRHFINVAGLAFDAQVVFSLSSTGKSVGSRFTYLKHVVTGLFSFRPKSVMIQTKEHTYLGKIYTLNIGICRYSGGGMQIVPHAKADDGLLAVTMVKDISKWKILLNLKRLFSGNIGKLKEVVQWQTEALTIEPSYQEKVLLEVDGEFLGIAPCAFKIEKNKINLLVPA
jgi:YegS/Rv2252/BmrU family lipid kinase